MTTTASKYMIPESTWRDECWENKVATTKSPSTTCNGVEDQPHSSAAGKGKERALTPGVAGGLLVGGGNALGLQDDVDECVNLEGRFDGIPASRILGADSFRHTDNPNTSSTTPVESESISRLNDVSSATQPYSLQGGSMETVISAGKGQCKIIFCYSQPKSSLTL